MSSKHAIDAVQPPGALACCLVSRQPVHASPDWCWSNSEGRYGIRVNRIGERIISLETWGHVNLNDVRHGWSVLRRALTDAPSDKGPFIVIDDHARISGATLNARRFIAQQLQHLSDWQVYIAYGAPAVFKLGLDLARRMELFSFPMEVVADYDEAIRLALEWQAHPSRQDHADRRDGTGRAKTPSDAAFSTDAADPSRESRDATLQAYARELFHYVGRLNLNRYGVIALQDDRRADHPFRAVYDALAMIHADMTSILARHQRNQRRLQDQERALLAKNAALAETQTTLKILLQKRREERTRQTVRIGQRFRDLLLPIVEGLADTTLRRSQQRQVAFIRDIITTISQAFTFNSMASALELTARETLTAYLVARGCTTGEAAEVMNTSPRTVEHYRAGLRRKAGLEGTGLPLRPWLNGRREVGPSSGSGSR